MGKRLSKIVTRTGDQGETGLGDGSRIAKNHSRVQAMGAVDELNSYIGLAIEEAKLEHAVELDPCIDFLKSSQHRIFDLGGELSIPGMTIITSDHVIAIEDTLTQLNDELKPLDNFILPGGNKLIAVLHLTRSICRRAERDIITLNDQQPVNPEAIKYLNRLSDFLFVAARFVAFKLDVQEILWQKS